METMSMPNLGGQIKSIMVFLKVAYKGGYINSLTGHHKSYQECY